MTRVKLETTGLDNIPAEAIYEAEQGGRSAWHQAQRQLKRQMSGTITMSIESYYGACDWTARTITSVKEGEVWIDEATEAARPACI